MSDIKTPKEVAPILGEVYWYWKDAEAEKEVLRKQFFDACTEAARKSGLAQRTAIVPDDIVGTTNISEYAERYNPGWLVISIDGSKVLIEEDPSLKGITEVVLMDMLDRNGKKQPGVVVTKTIVSGSVMVDTERMIAIDPDLYADVTMWKGLPIDDLAIDDYLEEIGWPREIRPDLSDSQIESIKEYTYEGRRSAKLNVRYAKPDESPGR